MNINKCKLKAILIALVLITACKKEKVNKEETVTIVPPTEVIIPPAEIITDNKSLPIQVKNGELKMTFSYTDTVLTKIEYADGKSLVLTFDDILQTFTLETYIDKELTGYTDYEVGKDGLVTRATQNLVNSAKIIYLGYATMEYNTKKQLTVIRNYNTHDKLLNERRRTYDDYGKLITETTSNPVQTLSYVYDAKYGLFKHVGLLYLFSLETNDPLFLSAINNLQGITGAVLPADNATYEFTYNKQDYPEKIKLMENGKSVATNEILYQ